MDVVCTPGAGVDGHQKTVMACRVPPDPTGQQADGSMDVNVWGTRTRDLLALSAGWAAGGMTPVARARTGEDGRPGYNLVDGTVPSFLVPAAQVTPGPGRQTDTAEARGLAQLRRSGWLAASGIPPPGQRDRRDVTRARPTLGPERSREGNRVPGVLERAQSKRASVATDIMGGSGRALVAALMAGRAEPGTRAALATGRRRATLPLLEPARTGLRRHHHRRLLAWPWAPLDFWDEPIDPRRGEITPALGELDAGVTPSPTLAGTTGGVAGPGAREAPRPPLPFPQAMAGLETIPGGDRRGAALLVAEGGPDMRRVGPASRLSAWTGVAPGNDASAGTPRSGKTRHGHRTRRTGLTHIAQAAARSQGPSLSALSHRVAARRGQKRAIMAVAQALVVRALHRLSRHAPYRELGPNDVDKRRRDHLVARLTRRLQHFEDRVQLEPVQTA
jgi:transposase